MPPTDHPDSSEHFSLARLNPLHAGPRHLVQGEEPSPEMALLKRWQMARLASTHQDLLNSERFGPASRFFLAEIYGAPDFAQREQDLVQVYESMRRLLPPRVVHTLELIVELNEVTKALDEELLTILVEELGMRETLTAEQYAQAYRLADNYGERLRQIELIVAVGKEVDWLVHRPFMGTTLRLARVPAQLAGWGELQGFFERGYKAFKQMGRAEGFLEIIYLREKKILDNIFTGDPEPFEI